MTSDTIPDIAWADLKAERMTIFAGAQTLAQARGFEISDEVHAVTGSSYFTASRDFGGVRRGFRVRISNHHPNARQVEEKCAFVTYHCIRRARRDLKRLIRRLERLEIFS